MRIHFLHLALFAPLILGGAAHPQSQQGQSTASERSASIPVQTDPSLPSSPHTAPVFWISSVEVLRSTHAPQLDVVRVRGLVPTSGWEKAELLPLTKGAPVDGVLDLALVAEAPPEETFPAPFSTVEAVFALEPGHPFHGVRVHGAANRVVLSSLPGYQEAAAAPDSCSGCVGKYLVRKGDTSSGQHNPGDILREEILPRNTRIVREADGLGTLEQDPNRLTLLLNGSGQVVAAMWD